MGWHSYVVPYETDEQLQVLLDLCKLHNSSLPATNVFVRYHEVSGSPYAWRVQAARRSVERVRRAVVTARHEVAAARRGRRC